MSKYKNIYIFSIQDSLLAHPEKELERSDFKITKFNFSLSSFFDVLWKAI